MSRFFHQDSGALYQLLVKKKRPHTTSPKKVAEKGKSPYFKCEWWNIYYNLASLGSTGSLDTPTTTNLQMDAYTAPGAQIRRVVDPKTGRNYTTKARKSKGRRCHRKSWNETVLSRSWFVTGSENIFSSSRSCSCSCCCCCCCWAYLSSRVCSTRAFKSPVKVRSLIFVVQRWSVFWY